MKVLVCGSKGKMGVRYSRIIKELGHEVVEWEIDSKGTPPKCDRAILATPTDTHFKLCLELVASGNSVIMCEKPLSKSPQEIKELQKLDAKINVVNNWMLTPGLKFKPSENAIYYNNCYTGKDGLYWDCCQLIYMGTGNIEIETDAPSLVAIVNMRKISLKDIEDSYKAMISAWLNEENEVLWDLDDALKMTEKVINHIGGSNERN